MTSAKSCRRGFLYSTQILYFNSITFWLEHLSYVEITVKPQTMMCNFIAHLFHTIAEASSIIFDLHWQFFAEAKMFELERLLQTH